MDVADVAQRLARAAKPPDVAELPAAAVSEAGHRETVCPAVTPTARGPAAARHASLERPWDLADVAQGLARAGKPPGVAELPAVAVSEAALRPAETACPAVTPTARGPAAARHASLERPWDLADVAQGLARAGKPPGGTQTSGYVRTCIR